MRICAIRMGPLLQMVEEEKTKDEESSEDSDPLLEPGDCLLTTVSMSNIPLPVIAATATVSQQLAENALQSIPTNEKELIPLYLCDFEDVYAKEFFDSLLERRTWDHVIELEPTMKPSVCKVYPLSPSEQLQLDEFLQENLHTGCICPLKSLMASPVFFIKKMDGLLLFWNLSRLRCQRYNTTTYQTSIM